MGVVVTGGAGFLGGHLVRTLSDAGHAVTVIDRRPLPAERTAVPGVDAITADLVAAEPATRAALAGADAVWHLAGCPGVRDDGPDVAVRRHRDNVLATAAVVDAVPADVPLVVASSSSVYGGSTGTRACHETDRPQPRGGYARSKVAVEDVCAQRAAAGGHVLVVRPFTVAGEGQRPDMALARWIDAALAGRPLDLLGSPERTRDVTDVVQVARVLLGLVERGATGTVNVGTGRGRTLRELADAVCRATGTDPGRVMHPAGRAEVRHTLACTRRLRDLLGTVPVTDLASLVERQVAATLAGLPTAGQRPKDALVAGAPR